MVGYNNDESIVGIGSMTVQEILNSDDMMRMHNRVDFFASYFMGSTFKKHNKQLQLIWEILINAVGWPTLHNMNKKLRRSSKEYHKYQSKSG